MDAKRTMMASRMVQHTFRINAINARTKTFPAARSKDTDKEPPSDPWPRVGNTLSHPIGRKLWTSRPREARKEKGLEKEKVRVLRVRNETWTPPQGVLPLNTAPSW